MNETDKHLTPRFDHKGKLVGWSFKPIARSDWKEQIGGENRDFPSDNSVPQNEPNTGEMK